MGTSATTERRGFTLVELLVVITIIGILVGMLLPAIQSARESGRVNTCCNNLKQIGYAMQHHETDHGAFPAGGWGWGWVGDPDRGNGLGQPGGWIYNSLNYLELQSLHDMGIGLDPTGTNPASALKKAANFQRSQVPLAGFLCPTRRAVALYPHTSTAVNYNLPTMAAKTDYAANGGDIYSSPDAMQLWPSNCGNSACGPPVSNLPNLSTLTQLNLKVMAFAPTGIVCALKMTSAAEVQDGLSNTYLVAEKYLEPELYRNGLDPADNECAYIGDNQDITRYTYSGNTFLPPVQDRRGLVNSIGFGSPHVNSFNACMGDVSVRRINYSIDPTVHRYLGNIADHQAVEPPN